jgi:quinol monooxygenase YgiN
VALTNDSKMVRIAEIEVDPHHLEDYKALLAEEIEASVRLEPGVVFLHGVALKGQPCVVRVFECYATRTAYEAHLTTPHFLKYKTGTLHMVKALKLVETDEIALASKPLAKG